jgi:monovalent cation:H+ antiporter-2, CPA2 family
MSLSSTIVLSHLMTRPGELQSEPGRVMLGITLVQELGVVALALLLPSLRNLGGAKLLTAGTAFVVGKAVLILAFVIFVTVRLLPRVAARVPRTRDKELYYVGALAWGFAIAAITHAVGLPVPLSAFLAGIVISGFEYAQQTFARLLPLRNACVATFLVTVGALINPHRLMSSPGLLIVILALIVLGKSVIWTTLVRLFRYHTWSAVLVGVGLTQMGEFSYVLLRSAREAAIVENDIYNTTLAALLLTILFSFFLLSIVRLRSLAGP